MKIKKSLQLLILLFASMLLLAACAPPAEVDSDEGEDEDLVLVDEIAVDLTRDWYVELRGDDANTCASVEDACLTLLGAYRKSALGDRIHIGVGTFVESGIISSILPIDHNLSIFGAGPDQTIIDGDMAIGGIFISPGSGANDVLIEGLAIQNTTRGSASGCIENRGSATLTIRNVEARNCWRSGIVDTGTGLTHLIDVYIHDSVDERSEGDFTLNGNGIELRGTMIIEDSEISNNPKHGIEGGAADLTLINTSIHDNASSGINIYESSSLDFDGLTLFNNGRTGLFQANSTTSIINSDIYANTHAAIFLSGGSLRMEASTIRDHAGRALQINSTASANLLQSAISNNGSSSEWVPTIWNEGRLVVQRSNLDGNHQIAIYNVSGSQATIADTSISNNDGGDTAFFLPMGASASFKRTLFANNSTGSSAALEDVGGDLEASNLTISNNSALGLRSRAPFDISYSTIVQNGGQGTLFEGLGGLLSNSLIIDNGGADCNHPSLDMVLGGSNFDSDDSCGFTASYSAAALGLAALADNGGFTRTHALAESSPAVDAASGLCPPDDQRSRARPSTPTECDLGAYEISDLIIAILPIEFEESGIVEILPIGTEEDPYAVAIRAAACREGADALFETLDFLFKGQKAALVGQILDGTWFKVELPDEQGRCWIFAENLELLGNLLDLAFLNPPELPEEVVAPDEDEGDSANQDGGEDTGSGNNNSGNNSGSTPTIPADPSKASIDNWICTSQDYEVTIGWNDNSDNEDGFHIYRDGNLLATVGANLEQYADNPPGSGPYVYSIEAFNNAGTSQSVSVNEGGCLP